MSKNNSRPDQAAIRLASMKDKNPLNIEMIIGTKDATGGLYAYNARLTNHAVGAIKNMILKTIDEYLEYEIIEYSYGVTPNNTQAMVIDSKEFALFDAIKEHFTDLSALALISEKLPKGKSLKYAAVRVDINSQQMILIQKLSQRNLISQKHYSFLLKKDVFDIQHGDLLHLQDYFEIFIIDSLIYFRNDRHLQEISGLSEEMLKDANSVFDKVMSNLPIENLDDMRQAVTKSINMVSKLNSILDKVTALPTYKKALRKENIFDFLDKRPDLGIKVIGEGKERRLVYENSPNQRYKILKLLDDDFLHSQWTSLDYEANSKLYKNTSN